MYSSQQLSIPVVVDILASKSSPKEEE
jgi:hypothetical protein